MGTGADEGRHDFDGGAGWSEVFELGFWLPDASLGGFARFELRPAEGICWFWTALLGEGRHLVTVLEFGSPLPRWPGIELRGPSLWSEMIIETPWEHATLGLEAFAVELENPADVFEGCRGDLVPLGYDLEWESPPATAPLGEDYAIAATVHGEILVGDEAIDFDGVGARAHSWGPASSVALPPHADDASLLAPVELPDGNRRGWVLDREGPYWADLSRR